MKNLKDKMLAKKEKTEAILEREGRQLLRLQVLLGFRQICCSSSCL